MSHTRLLAFLVVGMTALGLSACGGGGGQGLRVPDNPLLVASTSVPPMLSGESVDFIIPLEGGCGGPYVMKVIAGRMPEGLGLDETTHAIRGHLLQDGEFEFTLQITDAGCEPFSTASASFHMSVGVGEICVVDALRDGNSSLIPTGAESYNPDHPALPGTVYNDYVTIELVVAGGKGPYVAAVFDHPDIPDDGPLPLGASVPLNATSVTGAPIQVGPGGGPFKVTIQIVDSIGGTGYFTFYWLVETPPIVFATTGLAHGQAGVAYGDSPEEQIQVVEGVPPFVYEFVEAGLPADYTSDKSTNPGLDPDTDVIYNPGTPPTVTPPGALVKIDATVYPAPSAMGPAYDVSHQGAPSEGVVLDEETGALSGIPRRRGTFSVNAHVRSSLVPNSFGQHAWRTLGLEIAQSPPIAHDPAYTLDPTFTTAPPYARIAEAMRGEIYNPDDGPRGLQILAVGGVPDDGYTDAPHVSQRVVDPAETEGAYKWAIDWNPDGDYDTDPNLGVIPAMELTGLGIFRVLEIDGVPQVNDLIPQFEQTLEFTASDSALPDSLASVAAEKVVFGIGPDRILVTRSSTAMSPTSSDNRSWDDTAMALEYVVPGPSTYALRSPLTDDLTGEGANRHDLPSEAGAGTTPATLFASFDLLRVSVNPTGYWDDNVYLNPNAARPWQNSQRSHYYPYYGPGASGSTSYTGTSYTYGFQPSTSCVRLPTCKDASVAASRDLGVYTDGGKLHVFDTSTHFGVLIVREDGKLFVPAAFERATSGYTSFGDNWTYAYRDASTTHSATRIPQMTVSPDGRIAALKLRRNTDYGQYEYANTTDILLISLTGERISAWGGEVYRIVGSGSTGSSTTGLYLYASSLTLTNDYLYYVVGNQTTYAHCRDHYIYRYGLFGGNADDGKGALLHSDFNGEWTNSPGSPMQVPFQYFGQAFASSTSTGAPNYLMYASHGYNSWESSMAPHPFRVNSEGNACAILAGLNSTYTSAHQTVLWHHVWVDFQGNLTQLSTQRRHTSGGGRGISLNGGPSYTPIASMWSDYNGPTSRFEISDDGLKVAVVYFRNPTVDPYTTYNETVYRYREDIAAYASTDASWGGVSVREVTGDGSTNTGYSTSYVGGRFGYSSSTYDHAWRFGALTFTRSGDGLIFWGGFSGYDPDGYAHSYYRYSSAKSFVGSLYSYDFAGNGVRNILAASDGGANKTVGTAYTQYNYSPSSWQTDAGLIKPVAGFRSENGNFLYIATRGATSTSSTRQRDGALIGINVRSVNAAGSSAVGINGHQDGRAFYVDGFGLQNGFLSAHYYYPARGMGFYSYSSNYTHYYTLQGFNDRVAAMDNGRVFFTSVTATTSLYSSTSSSYGGFILPTYGYGYPYSPKKIYVFDANVGGNVYEVAGAGWTGSSYQHVSGLVVSNDGRSLIEAGSTYTNYNYQDRFNLTVFSGIDLDPNTGALPGGSVTRQRFENDTWTGDCASFSPRGDAIYYAVGGSSTGMTLKRGEVGGSTTGASLGLPSARWAVIHAGR